MMALSRQNFGLLLVFEVTLMTGTVTAQYYPEYPMFSVPIIVNLNAVSNPIVFVSREFGFHDYENNFNSSITIRIGIDPLVLTFVFSHFDVEYERSCNYDVLLIQGRPFCGKWAAGREFPFLALGESEFVLRFKTDEEIRKSGFKIIVRQEVAILD